MIHVLDPDNNLCSLQMRVNLLPALCIVLVCLLYLAIYFGCISFINMNQCHHYQYCVICHHIEEYYLDLLPVLGILTFGYKLFLDELPYICLCTFTNVS